MKPVALGTESVSDFECGKVNKPEDNDSHVVRKLAVIVELMTSP